jgi:hypothetical protein
MSARKALPEGAPALTGEALRRWSLAWERETGADSIATIERLYERTPSGGITCVYPGRVYTRRDPEEMWLHVHFSPKHGRAA